MDELRLSCLRIAVLVEVTFLMCFYLCGPVENWKHECIKKEHDLYIRRKEFLEWSVSNLQCEMNVWEATPLQRESFAREQLNMARLDEIVYYCCQQDNHDR